MQSPCELMKTYINIYNKFYNIYVSKNTALESFIPCIFDYFLYLSIKKTCKCLGCKKLVA